MVWSKIALRFLTVVEILIDSLPTVTDGKLGAASQYLGLKTINSVLSQFSFNSLLQVSQLLAAQIQVKIPFYGMLGAQNPYQMLEVQYLSAISIVMELNSMVTNNIA